MKLGKTNDQFANIANNLGHGGEKEGISRVRPEINVERSLPINNYEGDQITFPKK